MTAVPQLADLEAEIRTALDRDDARRARLDAENAMRRDIPDPVEYAFTLPGAVRDALLSARHNWLDDDICQTLHLVRLGLVEAGSGKRRRQLTAFASMVRRAIREDDA